MCEKCDQAALKVMALRGIGDLLNLAPGGEAAGRGELGKTTLAEVGIAINTLATDALVILGYDEPKKAVAT